MTRILLAFIIMIISIMIVSIKAQSITTTASKCFTHHSIMLSVFVMSVFLPNVARLSVVAPPKFRECIGVKNKYQLEYVNTLC
jgi:hypothetical protein